MITEELSQEEWTGLCKRINFETVFGQADFLEVYCKVYNVMPRFFVVKEHRTPRAALACFSTSGSIVLPTHYFFNPVWLDKNQGEIILNRALQILLTYLKKSFTRISLRLPVEVEDIRPFYWQGFEGKTAYTYLKNLQNLSYHLNINRILKKQCPYTFKIDLWSSSLEEFHKRDLISFGFRKRTIYRVFQSFKQLHEQGKMLIVNAYEGSNLVGSDVLLLDLNERKAYMFFISKSHGHYKGGLHAYLYNFIFSYLGNEGYKEIDMFGADYESISIYKSKFNPRLIHYYEVKYSKVPYLLDTGKKKIKLFLSRILQVLTS